MENPSAFPMGEPNDGFAQYFVGQVILHRCLTLPKSPSTTSPSSRDAATTGTFITPKRRRTDPRLCGRSRLLSGMEQTGTGAAPRRCGKHSDRGQALARCCAGQLVLSSGGRGSRGTKPPMNGWKPWTTQYILRQQARRSEYGKTESDTGMGQGVPEKRQGGSQEVTFHNRYGITLAADMFTPKSVVGKLPAIAVSGPFGAVKEQSSGLYAQKMAESDF